MNSELLSQRRRELALSRPELANRVGITARLLEVLEDRTAITAHEAISVGTVRALEAALGLAPLHLLRTGDRTPRPQARTKDDVALLGNVLARVGEPVSTHAIAAAAGWTNGRIERARRVLEHSLESIGLTMCSHAGTVTVSSAENERAARITTRLRSATATEDPDVLALVHTVWRKHAQYEEIPTLETIPAAEKTLARGLISAGILTLDSRDGLTVSAAIDHSLLPARPTGDGYTLGEW